MREAPDVDVTATINAARFGRLQWLVLALGLLTAMFDGYDTQGIAYVAPVIAKDLGMSIASLGPIFGSGLFGLTIGAVLFGAVADRWGRRRAIMASVLIFGIFSLLTPLGGSFRGLLVMRFLAGLGLGGALPNIIALIAEYAPARTRVLLVNSPNAFFGLGSILGGVVATRLIPSYGWQSTFYVGGALPLLMLVVLAVWLPESIRFLIVTGRDPAEAARLMRRVAPERNFAPATRFTLPEHMIAGGKVRQLFAAGRTVGTLLLWLACFMNLFVMLYLVNWTPTLLREAGKPLDTAILTTIWYSIGGFVGGLLLGRLGDRFGAYGVLVCAYVGAAVFIALGAASIGNTTILIVAFFLSGIGVQGGQGTLNTITADFYPTAIRATGVGWELAVGRVGSVVGPVLGGILVAAHWGIEATLMVCVVPMLIAAVAVFALMRRRCSAGGAAIAAPQVP